MIWGMATLLCDKGNNTLSDRMAEEVMDGNYTEEDAIKVQKQIEHEADLILRKLFKTRNHT